MSALPASPSPSPSPSPLTSTSSMPLPLRSALSHRLSAVFAMLLLACCGASAWLHIEASVRYEQEVTQRLSSGLAAHIAGHAALMRSDGLNQDAVKALFDQLMAVNPNVEVYLLDLEGHISAQAAPLGHLKQNSVDLTPLRQLLAGAALPVLGDDPRGAPGRRKVFSVAPMKINGRDVGYVYVVLSGEEREALIASVTANNVLRTTLWSMVLVVLLGLLAGLAAFRLITRPLRELTAAVEQQFEPSEGDMGSLQQAGPVLERLSRKGHGEIGTLAQSFRQMTQRIVQQWQELSAQDRQQREMFANISHDLRTPLMSLHGYLETLLMKAETLAPTERRRYLEIALGQSRKVGRLAQELFELARLECSVVKPEKERFALPDVVQDVFQKFELAAEARRQRLVPEIAPGLPTVIADLGMIERVLTNLLDNAIRHTPEGGEIVVRLMHEDAGVRVEVSDTGPGIPQELHAVLFTRPAFATGGNRDGGLGLMIVWRILQLHGSDIQLLTRSGCGAVFSFRLE